VLTDVDKVMSYKYRNPESVIINSSYDLGIFRQQYT
jgi:hypothetical protein